LLRSIDPTGLYSLEPEAEEQLVAMANDFANALIKKATKVAEHRVAVSATPRNGIKKRKRVEALDVSIVLKKHYGISIPGLPVKASKATLAEDGVDLSTARVLGDKTPVKLEVSDATLANVDPGSTTATTTTKEISTGRSVN